MVIDTLYDVQHARQLLDAISEPTAAAPVRYIFNTHTDGDHFFGNQVFPDDAQVVTTAAASTRMRQEHAELTASLFASSKDPDSPLHALHPLGQPFNFGEVRVRAADTTFSDEKAIRLGDLDVELHELGPAHTTGDAVAYLPQQRILFAGDLLTRSIIKIVWSGSITNWLAALDRIRAFGARTIVAGHGPVLTGPAIDDAIDLSMQFWSYIYDQASKLYSKGVSVADAPSQINVDRYPGAVVTLPIVVSAVYHEHDSRIPFKDLSQALESMAAQLDHTE
jgi:glyoxylase-like metal-dependent hydrolase (beta-lactamase superfamily II)